MTTSRTRPDSIFNANPTARRPYSLTPRPLGTPCWARCAYSPTYVTPSPAVLALLISAAWDFGATLLATGDGINWLTARRGTPQFPRFGTCERHLLIMGMGDG